MPESRWPDCQPLLDDLNAKAEAAAAAKVAWEDAYADSVEALNLYIDCIVGHTKDQRQKEALGMNAKEPAPLPSKAYPPAAKPKGK